MNTNDLNEPVNLDSSSIIELGRTAASQTSEEQSSTTAAPELPDHGGRCATDERELLSCQFDADSDEC